MTPMTCGVVGERAQVILVHVDEGRGHWERLSHTETRSHEDKAITMHSLWRVDSKTLKNTSIAGVS